MSKNIRNIKQIHRYFNHLRKDDYINLMMVKFISLSMILRAAITFQSAFTPLKKPQNFLNRREILSYQVQIIFFERTLDSSFKEG